MPLIARQRSRLAVLAVLALVGSLLAVSAVPVAAKDGEAGNTADHSACVGPAAEADGFDDVMAGSTHEAAIKCLAYYGITRGTGGGQFDPQTAITRAQMALFLHRAAGPVGVDLPAASDQGFIDIDSWAEAEDAINVIVGLGIMDGRTDSLFKPNDLVSRADMARHLDAFLMEATPGPEAFGGETYDDKFEGDDHSVFTDIEDVPKSTYDAILRLYEVGVTTGAAGGTTYNPAALVTRAQMASFFTRAMAHTNARPAGLTVQGLEDIFTGGTVKATVSLRDENRMPIDEAGIDSFYYMVKDDVEPFGDEGDNAGKCREYHDTDAPTNPVLGSCTMGSERTDENGNEDLTVATINDPGVFMVYFWTGEHGAAFDEDDSEPIIKEVTVSKEAKALKVTSTHGGERGTDLGNPGINDDSFAGTYVPYGETATVTIQLVDTATDAGVAIDDAKPVADSDHEVIVQVQTDNGKGSVTDSTETKMTDDSGKVELSFTMDDPDSDSDPDNTGTVVVTVSYGDPSLGGVATPRDPATVGQPIVLRWSDAKPKATTIKLTSDREYVKLPDKGSASVKISSQVLDQYGNPIPRTPVDLEATEGSGTQQPAGGFKYRGFTVNYEVQETEVGAAQRFGAFLVFDDDDDDNTNNPIVRAGITEDTNVVSKTIAPAGSTFDGVTVYWAAAASGTEGDGTVALVDKEENVIIANAAQGTANYAVYGSGDQFSDSSGAISMSKFEEELDVGDNITWNLSDDGVSTFTLG